MSNMKNIILASRSVFVQVEFQSGRRINGRRRARQYLPEV